MNRAQKLARQGAANAYWRLDFPMMMREMNGRPLAYLDSAASAQKPYVVINTMARVMEEEYANIHRGLYRLSADLTARFEDVRTKVARFIGAATPESIVFTRNATEGINIVAQCWGRAHLKSGDEIIISAMEHHANIVPWQMIAREMGAVIRVWSVDEQGRLDLHDLQGLMTEKTRVLAVTHVSNVLGTINDVAAIVAKVKSFNPDIVVVVDGSQGVVHGPVDVTAMGCDFYAFTGHKLYGPTGVGVLYGKPQILATMPPWQGGGDMIETVTFAGSTFRAPPHRFEAGTPAIIEVIGLGAAIDYVADIGWNAIAAHEKNLTTELRLALEDVPGLTIYGPKDHRAGIFAFTADFAHASDITMILDQCGVAVRAGHHCAMPLRDMLGVDATVRASIGLYNNSDDIMALAKGLHKAREMLT